MKRVRLTTVDNPYNPFDDFESWFMFDIEKGYYSCSKLARISNIDESMSDIEQNNALEEAIDRLIEIDPLDLYTKVYKEDDEEDLSDEEDDSGGV